jgi:hypothetical protein
MKMLALLATLILISPGMVAAQSSSGGGLGGVLDTLGGILGIGGGRMHGHVVLVKGDTLVVRGDDGRTLSLDASKTDPRVRGVLKPGDGVTVTLGKPREGEPRDAANVVADLQLDPPSQAAKSWQRVDGTIQEASKSTVTFRTRDGLVLPLDVSGIAGLPVLQPAQPATLIYEQGRQGPVAVWIEPGSALGQSSTPLPAPGPQPSASPDTGLQRVHGLVDSVTMTGFTLTSDEGRKVTVETSRMPQGGPRDVRPGDVVTVFGRAGASPDVLAAEFVQADTPRR